MTRKLTEEEKQFKVKQGMAEVLGISMQELEEKFYVKVNPKFCPHCGKALK